MKNDTINELELFAEELPEQVDLAVVTPSFSTLGTAATASCPASVGTVSSISG
ncbi:thiocillin family RiPP [Bacillus velezensis]|uniref:thiocillin family RiPP n=1 Tax=Bacillus velezensis TaxID=492670 RepID=UPI000B176945|nr:thiocillin family RiPP [Bacillus velezensis]AWK96222.1 hypothetical protein A2I97_19605 [Bacillus velezensis]NRR26428.1 thiocillin family RiPP [Bacillus velezensis]WFO87322.1 thiocillin family RiPP [Bacillus velezensis]